MAETILAFRKPARYTPIQEGRAELDLNLLITGMEWVVQQAGTALYKQIGVGLDTFLGTVAKRDETPIEFYDRVSIASMKAVERIQELQERYDQCRATLGSLRELMGQETV